MCVKLVTCKGLESRRTGSWKSEVLAELRNWHTKEYYSLLMVINSSRMRWAGNMSHKKDMQVDFCKADFNRRDLGEKY
jgi:hypothetical protein